jgi:hypothetical protein
MARFKDNNWDLPSTADGRARDWDAARLAVLMDIRDELKNLNRVLGCPNFLDIPKTLRSIRRKIPTPRPKKRTT